MRIVAVYIDDLQIEGTTTYTVNQATAHAILSGTPYEPISVERAGNYPAFIRSQIQPKMIPLTVHMLDTTYDARQAAYDALLLRTGEGLHDLIYEDDTANQFLLEVSCGPVLASGFLNRCACELTAWNPIAVAV